MSLCNENSDATAATDCEETIPGQELSGATVSEITLYVIEDIYKNRVPAPNQNQIVNQVTEIKNFGVPDDSKYDPKGQQPAVSRALKQLVARQKIIKKEDNTYIPYNHETERDLLREEIIKTVKFGKQPIFTISLSTWLVDVERSSIANAKNLFEKYLGSNCYNVLEFNGYLMLLVTGKKETRKALQEEIKQIQEEAISKNSTVKKK